MEAIQILLYLLIVIGLAIPLGKYISKVMNGEKVFLSPVMHSCEKLVYKVIKVDENKSMKWKEYASSVIIFSGLGFIILFILLLIQGIPLLNPMGVKGMRWDTAFNAAVSFVTNTNWQAYNSETQTTYLSQMLGFTVQNFVAPAVGISVLFVLIRAFIREKDEHIGNFFVDMTRSILYIFMPMSLVLSLLLVSQGVVQNFSPYKETVLIERSVSGQDSDLSGQIIPQGPSASQIAIKQLGTNGGGFFSTNSSHPLENPTAFSNLLEVTSILLIPVSLCFSFGEFIKKKRQGIAIFAAMAILLVISTGIISWGERSQVPVIKQSGMVNISDKNQSPGNMEGKESRLGTAASSVWTAFTTAASNGSVNSSLDSYTPVGGLIAMLQIQLGEIIFGGVGCGLYGMLAFALIAVFIAGLMVGRTPEFLGKKIEPFEMKMAMMVCLTTPVTALLGSGIACLIPAVAERLTNEGAHGFSEILYAYSSAAGNNGSSFAGIHADIVFLNISLGIVMILARFVPMLATLSVAGSLAVKKKSASNAGTLPTCNVTFVCLLIIVIMLIGALSFFPALALGPIAEMFQVTI